MLSQTIIIRGEYEQILEGLGKLHEIGLEVKRLEDDDAILGADE